MRQWIMTFFAFAVTLGTSANRGSAEDNITPISVIDRALKAGGGADKISQFKAISIKADAKLFDVGDVEFTSLFAAPTLFQLDANYSSAKTDQKYTMTIVGGGDTIWAKSSDEKQGVKEYHKGKESPDFERMERMFVALCIPDQLLALKGKGYDLAIVGDRSVNGVQSVCLRVKHEFFGEMLVDFDKESGLPVKSEVKLPESKKVDLFSKPGTAAEFYFENYKEFDGVRHFTKLRIRSGEDTIDIHLREIKLLKKVDFARFKKPG